MTSRQEEQPREEPPVPQSLPNTNSVLYDALLAPKRIRALQGCDRNLVSYNATSFWMVFRLKGRHFRMILLPLLSLLLWDLFLGLLLLTYGDPWNIRHHIQSMEPLVAPILTPVSFLLVFRLGRAAVRYWDARAAMGKLIEVCRTTSSTALVGCAPLGNVLWQRALAEDFVRWVAVFPVAVKNFLRPFRVGTKHSASCNRFDEVGDVLSLDDRRTFLATKNEGKYAPILVLNRLRALAGQLALTYSERQSEVVNGVLFRQLNEQIDVLTGAWGAMERINGTPLPFVYVVHLRTFLLLYLFFWHAEAMAVNGWMALPPLLLASWGLLGIEAAAVECERPFHWNSNHLALGRACIVVAQNLAQTMDNLGYIPKTTPSMEC